MRQIAVWRTLRRSLEYIVGSLWSDYVRKIVMGVLDFI
jgi:hypothetical protein